MNRPLDVHLGQRYPDTRLTLLERAGRTRDGRPYVFCRCDCGDTCRILWESIYRGDTKSCGCIRSEKGRSWGLARSSITASLGKWLEGSFLMPLRTISGGDKPVVECLCICGNTHFARWESIRRRRTKSCGHHRREALAAANRRRAAEARAA